MEKDHRYGHRQPPRCARYGYVVLVDSDSTRPPLTITLLVGGYEFLMEQCAFFENIVTARNGVSHLRY